MTYQLSNRLKELRKEKGYTQKELANLLGIAQTTIANYEQGTRIPDTEKLNKIADLFDVTLDYLLGRDSREKLLDKKFNQHSLDITSAYKTYLKYLLDGEIFNGRKLINDFYISGLPLEDIYFNILEKALKEVGSLWDMGQIDVWKEHFISEVTIDIMRDIKSKENKIKINPPTIIALNPGSELHNIGLKMISDILEIDGCNVLYLGSNVPVQSLINAIQAEKPDFITISTTLQHNIDSATNMITALRNNFGKKAPKIIVGGSAFINSDNVLDITGADYYCITINDIRNIITKFKA